MEILSCSLFCVSRPVGAVGPVRVVASFLCSRLVSCASVDVHLDSCDRTLAGSFKTVISTAPSSTEKNPQVENSNCFTN